MSDILDLEQRVSASERLALLKQQRANRRFGRILAGALGIIVLLVVRSALASDPDLVGEIPQSIFGTWVTDDGRYQDREFIILEDEFRIQVGPALEDIRAYPLRELRRFEEGDATRFEIVYASSDGTTVHEMTLLEDGTARLRNPRDVVWTRR